MSAPDKLPASATLLVIDLQKAIDEPYWGPRNNPFCEENVAALLQRWRTTARPLYHIKHNSEDPASAYRAGHPGNAFKEEVRPYPHETVIAKHLQSAFVETNLETRLRRAGHTPLVIAGVLTNNSVETTVRMGANLGFDIYVVSDGCFAVEKRALNGQLFSADDVHALSLANMQGEYATVVDTEWVLART